MLNFDTTSRDVTIAENFVTNYNSNGITVFAQGDPEAEAPAVLTAHVHNNTVVGVGENDVIDQYGIQFGPGVENAIVTSRVRENTVRDNVATDSASGPGYGIFVLIVEDMTLRKNILRDNQVGVGVFES